MNNSDKVAFRRSSSYPAKRSPVKTSAEDFNTVPISESFSLARKTWDDWSGVFEHSGPISDNPLLADPSLFARFLKLYSVSRTIRSGAHDRFRRKLIESQQFLDAIHDDTGHSIDDLEGNLRTDFGTHDGKNRIVSVLSKVATFIRPERFTAWDAYAKRGVNVVLERSAYSQINTYADYLAMFDKAWDGHPGQKIRDYAANGVAQCALETQPRFLRRVLDVYLMKRGGRKL